jgi:signal transduction histidine kinase
MGLSKPTAARLAWGSLVVSAALTVAAFVVYTMAGPPSPDAPESLGLDAGTVGENVLGIVLPLAFSIVGALVASRRPDNVVGWLLCSVGLLSGLEAIISAYGYWAIIYHPGSLPGGDVALWIGQVTWLPSIPLGTSLFFLLFPDGALPSPRWRPMLWLTIAGAILGALGAGVLPTIYAVESLPNPVYAAPAPIGDWLIGIGFIAVIVGLVASGIGLFLRYRRSDPEIRQQIKWFAYAAVATLVIVLPSQLSDHPSALLSAMGAGAAALIPLSIGIAVLRHRLYDIDLVIRKTLIYGVLAGFITALYIGIVVGIGTLVGRGGEHDLWLSVAATAAVAVLFQPVRERVNRVANRLIFGKRATPYEVLTAFSERLGGAYADEDVLSRMSRLVGEGIGAERAEVWLRVGDELRAAATWPAQDRAARPSVRLSDGAMPDLPGSDATYPIEHRGELLGALAVTKPPAEPLTPSDVRLVADLAAQAGLVVRNVRLTEELRARLEDLTRAQRRLVTAQDEERRRIERNIHDGAQQQLVALAVKLRLADSLVGRDDQKAHTLLGDLKDEVSDALEDLRDLARGVYPPLLADKGLAAALDAQARKAAVPTAVDADGVGRFSQDVEATVYFSCLEALQNVAKYSEANAASVRLRSHEGHLQFVISDDGRGFDPKATGYGTGLQGIADRLAAIGGTVEVRSAPGMGTSLTGRIPVEELT